MSMKKTFTKFLAFTIFFQPLLANANGIVTKRKPNGDLVLVGKSCNELQLVLQNICTWKNNFENPKKVSNLTPDASKEKCKQNKSDFEISMNSCAPRFTLDYHEKKLINEGPNCWGTAMSFQHYSAKPRFMWPEEMNYWMQSSLCREIKNDEKKVPGDIINVYAPDYVFEEDLNTLDAGEKLTKILTPEKFIKPTQAGYTGYDRLLHSAVYIHPKLAFGKNSPDKEDRFFYHPPEEIYGRPPESEKECQENSTLPINFRLKGNPTAHHRRKCSYFTKVFRCENFTNHFDDLKLKGKYADYLSTIRSLSHLQSDLFPLLTSKVRKLEKCEYDLLSINLQTIIQEVTSELGKKNFNKEQEMVLVYLYFTAEGLNKTLKQFTLSK